MLFWNQEFRESLKADLPSHQQFVIFSLYWDLTLRPSPDAKTCCSCACIEPVSNGKSLMFSLIVLLWLVCLPKVIWCAVLPHQMHRCKCSIEAVMSIWLFCLVKMAWILLWRICEGFHENAWTENWHKRQSPVENSCYICRRMYQVIHEEHRMYLLKNTFQQSRLKTIWGGRDNNVTKYARRLCLSAFPLLPHIGCL